MKMSVFLFRVRFKTSQGQREGQALFNALHDVYPDLANEIRATEIDPYYVENTDRFYEWLMDNWPGTWD